MRISLSPCVAGFVLLVVAFTACAVGAPSEHDGSTNDAATGGEGGHPGSASASTPSDDGVAINVADVPPQGNPACPKQHLPPKRAHYVYPRVHVTPFYQWQNNDGYCGEVGMIQAGMNNGQWMSQLNARLICGAQGNGKDAPVGTALSQSGPDGYCAAHGKEPDDLAQVLLQDDASANPAQCLSNSRLAFETYHSTAEAAGRPGYETYMAWIKAQVFAGTQVTIGVLDGEGDDQIDHIVTVAAIGTDHDLGDASYFDDDVLYIEDHTANDDTTPAIPPGGGGESPGCATYFFGFTFASLPMTRKEYDAKGLDYGIVMPGTPNVEAEPGGDGIASGPRVSTRNYAFAVSGPADDEHVLLPITLKITGSSTNGVPNPPAPLVGLNYENPFIGTSLKGNSCTNLAPAPMQVTLEATVSGLVNGAEYNLYEYDFASVSGVGAVAALKVPTARFNAQASLATKTTHFTAQGSTYVTSVTRSSQETVVFRAVPKSAP